MTKPTLSVEDLKAIYVRSVQENGNLQLINLAEATHTQFGEWFASRVDDLTNPLPLTETWTMEQRAAICNELWQKGALTLRASEASQAIQAYVGSLKTTE